MKYIVFVAVLAFASCISTEEDLTKLPEPALNETALGVKNRGDYKKLNNKSYKLYDIRDARSWNDARKVCLDDNGYLAIIKSEDEASFIKQMMYDIRIEEALVGFSELYNIGDYVTVHGKSLASTGYIRWADGEPNRAGPNEHCGAFRKYGDYNDVDCYGRYSFVCERLLDCDCSPV